MFIIRDRAFFPLVPADVDDGVITRRRRRKEKKGARKSDMMMVKKLIEKEGTGGEGGQASRK